MRHYGQKLDLERTIVGHRGHIMDKSWIWTLLGQNLDIYWTCSGLGQSLDKTWETHIVHQHRSMYILQNQTFGFSGSSLIGKCQNMEIDFF